LFFSHFKTNFLFFPFPFGGPQVELLQARQRAAELNLALMTGRDVRPRQSESSPPKLHASKGTPSTERFQSLARQVKKRKKEKRKKKERKRRRRRNLSFLKRNTKSQSDRRNALV
jgi:hypothetical protein